MTIDEKKEQILKAIASNKVTGVEIDRVRRGATVSSLKAGKALKPVSIERLYANMEQILAQKEQSVAQGMEQNKEQKEQSVAQSTEQNKEQIVQGTEQKEQVFAQTTEQKTIAELQARVMELERENRSLRDALAGKPDVQGHEEASKFDDLLKRVAMLESKLETRQDEHAVSVPSELLTDKEVCVSGFRLVNKTTKTGDKVYRKWYAVRGQMVVYIGNDLGKAQEKISAYLQKHGLQNDLDTANQPL